MKNYKVIATRYFRDSNEIDKETGLKKEREINDVFCCTKERYEYLKQNNAVKLLEIQENINDVVEEKEDKKLNEEDKKNDKVVDEIISKKKKTKKK